MTKIAPARTQPARATLVWKNSKNGAVAGFAGIFNSKLRTSLSTRGADIEGDKLGSPSTDINEFSKLVKMEIAVPEQERLSAVLSRSPTNLKEQLSVENPVASFAVMVELKNGSGENTAARARQLIIVKINEKIAQPLARFRIPSIKSDYVNV